MLNRLWKRAVIIRSTKRPMDEKRSTAGTPKPGAEAEKLYTFRSWTFSRIDDSHYPFGGPAQDEYRRFLVRRVGPEADPETFSGDSGEWITGALDHEGFPVHLAEMMAVHCRRVYSPPVSRLVDPLRPAESLAAGRLRWFQSGRSHGYGFVFENHGFLVLCGTDEWGDWLDNADAVTEVGYPKRHRGFETCVSRLSDQIESWLDDLPPEVDRFVCGGHSLGGAMAVLIADRLHHESRRVRAVITFGAPRVGGAEFFEAYGLHDVTWQAWHGRDPIPALPPASLGYRHVGHTCNFYRLSPNIGDRDGNFRTIGQAAGLVALSMIQGGLGTLAYLGTKHLGPKLAATIADSPDHAQDRYLRFCERTRASAFERLKVDEELARMHLRYLRGSSPALGPLSLGD